MDLSLNNIDEKFIDIIYPSAFNNEDCKIKSIDFGCNKINVQGAIKLTPLIKEN